MNSKINYKVEDFLRDDEFICYALNISSEAYMKWEGLLKEYSMLANEAEKAKAILTGEDMVYTLEPQEKEELKARILESFV
ncbi:hypothetical protein [Bacteroides sp. 51]|uniref:hypothetical protein n=1 Tax=Bacteroides sp. 51 TaxID=2302938 RepID=UPI0013D58A77|nr:hypothetical protein [Bacteroides sp. 51]NDV82014.1 hypothetical protein [Bacteroides sp. 51]